MEVVQVMAGENIITSPWDMVFGPYESFFPAGLFWVTIFFVLIGAVWLKTRNIGMTLGMMVGMGGIFGVGLPLPARHIFLIFSGVGLGGLLFLAYVKRR